MRFWTLLIFGALGILEGCSEECVREACDDADRAQTKGSIETGIVGVAAYRTDACENDCCACEYTSSTLLVFEIDASVADADDAQARLGQATPLHTLSIETRYAQELPPGRYALCDPQLRTCANLELAGGEVFTVNVQAIHGPMLMRVFDDAGQRRMELVIGDGAPY